MPTTSETQRQGRYDYWLTHATPYGENKELLAKMLSSWECGHGSLPPYWGLSPRDFNDLLNLYFPTGSIISREAKKSSVSIRSCDRKSELKDLIFLIMSHCEEPDQIRTWSATIMATACLGENHLWQDLGFWSRDDLNLFIQTHFPLLATMNARNMKWKKFLYRQLCEQEEIYICRSPSCEQCVDYSYCFSGDN